MENFQVGLVIALVSMIGTLIALSLLALCIYGLRRFLPETEPAEPAKPAP